MAASSWAAQSHRTEWNASPVRHRECTRTRTSSPFPRSPRTRATWVSPLTMLSNPTSSNSPKSVGSFDDATRRTRRSLLMRYLIRSAIVIMSSLWRRANRRNCGTRAMVPSSFMISQITPAGLRPAMRARSTAASVWPARTSTPPSRARNGNMWPGRVRSRAWVAGSAATRAVVARSAAEMPVLVDSFASTDTQNAVSNRDVFSRTIRGMSSRSSHSPVIGRQMRPRPCFAMKLMISGVVFSAATVRSPSFSRSSSSTTMTIPPSRMASTASSTGANGPRRRDLSASASRLRRACPPSLFSAMTLSAREKHRPASSPPPRGAGAPSFIPPHRHATPVPVRRRRCRTSRTRRPPGRGPRTSR